MELDNKDLPLVLFVVGQVATIFGFGRAYQKVLSRVQSLEEKREEHTQDSEKHDADFSQQLTDINTAFTQNLDDVIKRFETKLSVLEARFHNDNGEPLLITYRAHDKMQEKCHAFILGQLDNFSDSLDKYDDRQQRFIRDMGDEVRKLISEVSKISGRMEGMNEKK